MELPYTESKKGIKKSNNKIPYKCEVIKLYKYKGHLNCFIGTDSQPKSKRRLFKGKTGQVSSEDVMDERSIWLLEGRLEGDKINSRVRNEEKEGKNCRMGENWISLDTRVTNYDK